MVYKKIQNEEGKYLDAQQVRWDILEAHEAWTPEGLNVGWDEYDNLEQAIEAYGLTCDQVSEKEPEEQPEEQLEEQPE